MRVLFIEDDRMNRRVVKDMLDVAGAVMTEAGDGETGLGLLEANEYDMVLVDLRMPGMDGTEVIRRIRARADAKAGLPVIVVTADTGAGLADMCLEAGADDVLFKPVAMEALFDSMGQVLAKRAGEGGMVF